MKRSPPSREANIWVARGVPVVLLGIVGYASWVITKVLCVDYLLQPDPFTSARPRIGATIAILVVYYVLLFVMLVCYARLVYVVTRYPGLVPRGSHWYTEHTRTHRSRRSRSKRRHTSDSEKAKRQESDSSEDRRTAEVVTSTIATDADIDVSNFWQRDIFTCGHDGRPAFCSTCYNWKPDRAHHCSELDRCVLKMDHFCPWVGGVVGETSFKFFIQFTFWGALFCTHILVTIAYYFAERRRVEGTINVHWTVILAISALFLLFSAGMCMSSLQFAFINSTTIENLSRKRKVWYLAVHVPDHILRQIEDRGRSNLRFITYPRPPAEQFQILEQNGANPSQDVPEMTLPPNDTSQPTQALRTFAILETAPGANPFDLGFEQNFTDMMGSNVLQWLLPIHSSPSVRHDSTESFYKMGTIVDQLKREARITDGPHMSRRRRSSHRKHRRSNSNRRSNSTHHEQNLQ